MPSNPKISVIMPVYNTEKYVAKAIESILGQTFKDFEFIIINDASTDSSPEIINSYAKNDGRIVVVNNESNLNIAESRNKGVYLAKGDYIVTMDADDISVPDRLQNQLDYLEEHSEISITIGDIDVIDEKGNVKYRRKYPESDSELKRRVYKYNPFPNPTIMCKRVVYVKTGTYDNNYVPIDDFDFWLRAGVNFKFGNCRKVVLLYRIILGSASHGKLRKTEMLTFLLRKKAYSLGYKYNFTDIVYNILHIISFKILPTNTKIVIFNFLRNYKILN